MLYKLYILYRCAAFYFLHLWGKIICFVFTRIQNAVTSLWQMTYDQQIQVILFFFWLNFLNELAIKEGIGEIID